MKILLELLQNLTESVDFMVADYKEYTDAERKAGKHNHKGIYTTDKHSHEGEVECFLCDGSGKFHDRECERCEGVGKTKETIYHFPSLNVSNHNAGAIIDMLGLEWDYAGTISNKDLPEVKRKLIWLKNTDLSKHTEQGTDERNTRVSKDEHGNHKISAGPRIITGGRDLEQVKRYVDKLLQIVDYAQKHKAHVTWG